MLSSLIFAWIATISAFLAAIKLFVKKNRQINLVFHKIHIPLGVILIAAGLIHGLLAGNVFGTSLADARYGELLFTLNMGTVCLILSILLGLSYVLRHVLKKNWMICHRVLTVLLAISVVIHIAQMGISLPKALTSSLAKSNESINSTEASDSSDITEESVESLVTFSGAKLIDGTYSGSAEGFNGDITVSVTVTDGAVTDISILSENDTPNYFERAKDIITNILDSQSLEVDSISGATYSSKGIRDAVYNALQNAVDSGELEITEIQISGGHGKHGPNHH